jgi:hypothetical protein
VVCHIGPTPEADVVVDCGSANAQTPNAVSKETCHHKNPLPQPHPVQDGGVAEACGLSSFIVGVKFGALGSVAQNT